jgi:uncharacterized protein YkwD
MLYLFASLTFLWIGVIWLVHDFICPYGFEPEKNLRRFGTWCYSRLFLAGLQHDPFWVNQLLIMEHSTDPDRRYFRFCLSLPLISSSLAIVVVVVIFFSSASTSYGWWFDGKNLNLTPIKGSLVLSTAYTATTAISLEPISIPTPTPQSIQTNPTIASVQAHVQPTKVATSTSPSTSMAEKILTIVNQERQAQGLTTLVLNSALSTAAQKYALQMQSQLFFSHTSPDGSTFVQRDAAAGYTSWTWLAENIAYGQQSAQEVMTSWMNSPNHRANILDPKARDLGVGYAPGATPYWVQEFGAR